MVTESRLIFVSGPLTSGALVAGGIGFNAYRYEQNVQLAERTVVALNRAGFYTICVHSESRNMFGEFTEAHAIASGIAKLKLCDGLCLTNGWDSLESSGTVGEIRVALKALIPIYLNANACIDRISINSHRRIMELRT